MKKDIKETERKAIKQIISSTPPQSSNVSFPPPPALPPSNPTPPPPPAAFPPPQSPPPSSPAPPTSNRSTSSSLSTALIVGISIGAVIGLTLLVGLVLCLYFKKRLRGCRNYIEGLEFARPSKFKDLKLATNGFAESNVLGQGGFGKVYRGMLSGKDVAIKKMKPDSQQGDGEFRAEVKILSQVDHPNLVPLDGYCVHNNERLLVYEYVPNKTLQFHLHESGRPTLDWPKRWKISLGIAKGLAYLHEGDPKIIHRDIKAENILLDNNFEPKVADFGLAKFVPPNMTHVSTRIAGTFGYIAPEYYISGRLREKSDVYSYGVMLLELITGRKPIMDSDPDMDLGLVNWAKPYLTRATKKGIFDELIDPSLETNYDQNDMKRLIHCAAAAVQKKAKKRPPMRKIERYLEAEIDLLEDQNAGMRPGDSMVNANSTEQKMLRRMAFGGVSSADLDESDQTSDYDMSS